jgi:hypothetical protein
MKVNSDRFVSQNIELSAEFSRYIFEHPDLEDKIPRDAEVILVPEFDPVLKQHNLKLGRKMKKQGAKVVFVTLNKMRPKAISRIESLAVQ